MLAFWVNISNILVALGQPDALWQKNIMFQGPTITKRNFYSLRETPSTAEGKTSTFWKINVTCVLGFVNWVRARVVNPGAWEQ